MSCRQMQWVSSFNSPSRRLQDFAESDFQATSKGRFQSRNNPVHSDYGRNFSHTTSQLSSTISNTPNTNNRRGYNQNNFNPCNPNYGNNSSHQPANQQHSNPQHSIDRSNTQFRSVTSNELIDDSSKLPRVQNHTSSRNGEPTWIRAFIQLQAILVTLFYKDLNIETYALLDSGSDNTQITQNIADALRIRVPKDIELPLASLHGKHTMTTADVMIGIGSLRSSKPVTNLPVYATSIDQFQMPTVPAEMLNRLCRDHDHLAEVNFPQIRDNKIGILIGADAFLATVPRNFTTGKPGTPYGVNTMLGRTLTGPVPQEYFQPNNTGSSNHNITLINHHKRGSDDPDENLLHLFWTFEGVNFSQGSKKGQNEEDQKALKTLVETTYHNGKRYEIGLPWRENVTLPNIYFMARVQWQALQKRLERDNQLKQRYMTTIFDDMDKGYITAVTNQDAKNIWYLPSSHQQAKTRQDKTNDKCSLKIQRGFFERCTANRTGPFVQSTWTSPVSSVRGCSNSRHRGYVHASWNQRRRPRCSPFFVERQ